MQALDLDVEDEVRVQADALVLLDVVAQLLLLPELDGVKGVDRLVRDDVVEVGQDGEVL